MNRGSCGFAHVCGFEVACALATFMCLILPVTGAWGQDLDVAPADEFVSTGPIGGPFDPLTTSYKLTNPSETDELTWRVDSSPEWLTFSSIEHTLATELYVYEPAGTGKTPRKWVLSFWHVFH